MENKIYLGLMDIDSMSFFVKESKTNKQIIDCDKIEITARPLETTHDIILKIIQEYYKVEFNYENYLDCLKSNNNSLSNTIIQLIKNSVKEEINEQDLKKIVNEEIWTENAMKCIIQNIKENNYENCLLLLPPKVSARPGLVQEINKNLKGEIVRIQGAKTAESLLNLNENGCLYFTESGHHTNHCKEFIKIAKEFELKILDEKDNLDSKKATLEFNKTENTKFKIKFTNYLDTTLKARYYQVEKSAQDLNVTNYKTTTKMLEILQTNNLKNANDELNKSSEIGLTRKF